MTTPFETYDNHVVVDVWSDIMCPFCYMGDTLLAHAVEQLGRPVEIRYHSFQLMPELPAGIGSDLAEILERKRGFPRAQAAAMNARVSARAAEIGLVFDTGRAIATNTRAAHGLIHFAKAHGREHEMVERLFRAFFTDGLHIGDVEVLADLADEVGLDRDKAREVVDSDAYGEEVDRDVQIAHQLGITGVPFFVFDGRYAISGAQPVEAFAHALTTAWQDHQPTDS